MRNKVFIYPSLGESYSMKRYLRGLESGLTELGESFEVVRPNGPQRGARGLISKYFYYPLLVLRKRNKLGKHIIISERYAYLLLFLYQTDSIVVCHDLHTLNPKANVSLTHKSFYRWLLGLMSLAAKIVCVSEYTRMELVLYKPHLDSSKILTVHNGLETLWHTQTKETFINWEWARIFDENKVLLSVGTDSWYKNFSLTLSILADLPEEYQLLRIGDVGEGSSQMIEKLRIGHRIVRVNNISDKELLLAYQKSSCLIFPSLSEGFGWPALESIASGCPVLTSGSGSIREVCQDNAIYCAEKPDYLKAINDLRQLQRTTPNYQFLGKYEWKTTALKMLAG